MYEEGTVQEGAKQLPGATAQTEAEPPPHHSDLQRCQTAQMLTMHTWGEGNEHKWPESIGKCQTE